MLAWVRVIYEQMVRKSGVWVGLVVLSGPVDCFASLVCLCVGNKKLHDLVTIVASFVGDAGSLEVEFRVKGSELWDGQFSYVWGTIEKRSCASPHGRVKGIGQG